MYQFACVLYLQLMVFIQIDNPCFVVPEFSKSLFQSQLQKNTEFSCLVQVTSLCFEKNVCALALFLAIGLNREPTP